MRSVEFKVPGGKLLRVKSKVADGKISFIQVTGDLEQLEEALIGRPADPEAIESFVNRFFTERNTTITGASPSDFARIISESIKV